jgi:uncharacterized membrane protein
VTVRRLISSAPVGLGALLSVVIAIASYRYLIQLGPVPPNVADNRFFLPWIVIHATAAATALLVGVAQLLPAIRQRWPALHRWAGRVYVIGCLVGGFSGLVLSVGVSAGPIAAAGFGILGVLWIYVTSRGWLAARRRSWAQHRRWMLRSYALTFAAVTLRLYLPLAVIASIHGYDFMVAYRFIAWFAWVPNAIFAELFIRRGREFSKGVPA